MSRQQISAHYTRLLRLWPIDRLRPAERHFQRVLEKRIQSAPTNSNIGNEVKQVNAAYLLLDDAFTKQTKLSANMMKPASDPMHYERLATELEEAPDRGFVGRLMKKLGGMVRFR